MKKWVCFCLCACMLMLASCGADPGGVNETESGKPAQGEGGEYAIDLPEIRGEIDSAKVLPLGRTVSSDGVLYLYWTSSGCRINMTGTGLVADLWASTVASSARGYLDVFVDGSVSPTATVCIDKTGSIELVKGLSSGSHTVEILKRNEAGYADSATIGIKSLSVPDGTINDAPSVRSKYIEFIGDWTLTGYGNQMENGLGLFSTSTEFGNATCTRMLSEAVGADFAVIARSDLGFVPGSSTKTVQAFYDKTATVPGSVLSEKAWDFESRQADYVIVSLGEKELTAVTKDGHTPTNDQITNGVKDLVATIRKYQPDAKIIWAYGVKSGTFKNAISRALTDADANAYFCPLATSDAIGAGSGGAWTRATSVQAALKLAAKIEEVSGQTLSCDAMLKSGISLYDDYRKDTTLRPYTAQSVMNLMSAFDAADKASNVSASQAQKLVTGVSDAVKMLLNAADVKSNYDILFDCDTISGWSGARLDNSDRMEGAGCIYSSASTGTLAMDARNINYDMPSNWEEWYLELWMYVSDVTLLTDGSCLELAQDIDKIEAAWTLKSMPLKDGWNHLVLSFGNSVKENASEFKTLKSIRLFNINTTELLTIKMDYICMTEGLVAGNTSEWLDLIGQAKAYLEIHDDPEVKEAYEIALEAKTQAEVDRSSAVLGELLE